MVLLSDRLLDLEDHVPFGPHVIRRRQELYAEETSPLIDVYAERGMLLEVDGMGTIEQVTERIFDGLEKLA